MRSLFESLPSTYALWPVWRDSTTQEVRYEPLSKRRAVQTWHKIRRFERQTRRPGHQDGIIGRNGLAVAYTLLFDFINYATGRLDPAQITIAKQACISPRSVARGLVRLKAAGILNWLRRCCEDRDEEGRFRLRQQSNAYAVLPSSYWRGYIEPQPPPLEPWQIGAPVPLDPLAQALATRQGGGSDDAILASLKADPANKLALSLARWLPLFEKE